MVRPLLSGRDYHALHHENPGSISRPKVTGARVLWRPYPGVPAISAVTDGSYRHEPVWYRNFQYDAERERGLDFTEDLASPGAFAWTLNGSAATLMLSAGESRPTGLRPGSWTWRRGGAPLRLAARARGRRPMWFAAAPAGPSSPATRGSPTGARHLHHAARLHGPCRAGSSWRATSCSPGRRRCPRAWCRTASRMPASSPSTTRSTPRLVRDRGARAAASRTAGGIALAAADQQLLQHATSQIVAGYRAGTRLASAWTPTGCSPPACPASSSPGWTPRSATGWSRRASASRSRCRRCGSMRCASRAHPGPNTARCTATRSPRSSCASGTMPPAACTTWSTSITWPAATIRRCGPTRSSRSAACPIRCWSSRMPPRGRDGRAQAADAARPALAGAGRAGYRPHYGGVPERDGAYHQGTAWPWLIGPFVEAWLRVRGDTPRRARGGRAFPVALARASGRRRPRPHFGGRRRRAPHRPGGCPFQAWSLGELLRASRLARTSMQKRAAQQPRARAAL